MKKKLFALTLAVAMVFGLNVAVFAGGGGSGGWPLKPTCPPVCTDCCDLYNPE